MASRDGNAAGSWPVGARVAISLALIGHLGAMVIAAFASDPASPLQRALADACATYYQLIDQGYSYRYYAPEPPPTPVIECRLRYGPDQPERTIRLPDRSARPRMRYQRQLALANHLYQEFMMVHGMPPEAPRPALHWGPSFARHLGRVHGCREVAFFARLHLIPPLAEVQRRLADPAAPPIDLDAEEFYTEPELVGTYSCDAS